VQPENWGLVKQIAFYHCLRGSCACALSDSALLKPLRLPLESFWDPVGILLGSPWNPFGIALDPFRTGRVCGPSLAGRASSAKRPARAATAAARGRGGRRGILLCTPLGLVSDLFETQNCHHKSSTQIQHRFVYMRLDLFRTSLNLRILLRNHLHKFQMFLCTSFWACFEHCTAQHCTALHSTAQHCSTCTRGCCLIDWLSRLRETSRASPPQAIMRGSFSLAPLVPDRCEYPPPTRPCYPSYSRAEAASCSDGCT